MFWKKKKKATPVEDPRDTLFGDLPIETWAINDTSEPWASFKAAKDKIESNQPSEAIEILKGITEQENLESRHYIQAFHHLKQLGCVEEGPTQLFGVVVEIGFRPGQYDLLATYSDLSVRYYNFSGNAIFWEHPNNSLDDEIKDVLELGTDILNNIGPWDGARPYPIRKGKVRLNLLTSKGLHFGEGPMSVMTIDPLGEGLLNAATILMDKLSSMASQN